MKIKKTGFSNKKDSGEIQKIWKELKTDNNFLNHHNYSNLSKHREQYRSVRRIENLRTIFSFWCISNAYILTMFALGGYFSWIVLLLCPLVIISLVIGILFYVSLRYDEKEIYANNISKKSFIETQNNNIFFH